jgi:catechol 2,3-dioxygenase-like lactoylglutathione lyase family enzyme
MNIEGLAYASVYVADLEATERFYGEVLGLSARREAWGLVVQAGAIQLLFHATSDLELLNQRLELTFVVDDVDTAFGELEAASVPVVEPPVLRTWGDRDGAVADPDGNTVYLSERP